MSFRMFEFEFNLIDFVSLLLFHDSMFPWKVTGKITKVTMVEARLQLETERCGIDWFSSHLRGLYSGTNIYTYKVLMYTNI